METIETKYDLDDKNILYIYNNASQKEKDIIKKQAFERLFGLLKEAKESGYITFEEAKKKYPFLNEFEVNL